MLQYTPQRALCSCFFYSFFFLSFFSIWRNLPRLDLEHAALLLQRLVQVEAVEQQVRLVTHTLAQTVALGLLEVVGEDGLVLGVGALLDDDTGALAGAQTADVGKTLLGDDNVKVMLGLVDVGAHWDDA